MTGPRKDWRVVPLGELTNPESRGRVKPQDYPDLDYVGMKDVESETMRLLGTVPASAMKSSAVRFQPGDVLYGRLRPYLNKVWLAEFEGLGSPEFIVMPPSEGVHGRYLQYFLNHSGFVRFATSLNTGDRPRVDFDQLKTFPVHLPPYEQQLAIVEEIEKQFTRLAAAVELLRRIQANLTRYRSVLLREVFSQDFSGTGEHVPLGDVCSVHVGATPSRKKKDYWGGSIPWVVSRDLHSRHITSTAENITEAGLKSSSTQLHPEGTVLLGMIGQGPTRGLSAELRTTACTSQNLAAIRPKEDGVLLPSWLLYFFDSQYETLRSMGSGNNQKALNKRIIESIRIPVPPRQVQIEAVCKIEKRLSLVHASEAVVRGALAKAKSVHQGVLSHAFSGTLILEP